MESHHAGLSVGSVLVAINYLAFVAVVKGGYSPPVALWPLTDESYGAEVKSGTNHAALSNCAFDQGLLTLNTQSLVADGGTSVEITNTGNYFAMDFMLSALFYPTSAAVTLFHYVDNADRDVFKVWSTGSTLRVAVYDAITGISIGSSTDTYTLSTKSWSQIGFLREQSSGKLMIYVGTNKVTDIDDGFPDSIGLPNGGRLRVGTSFDSALPQFVGRISCIQVYLELISEGEMDGQVLDSCQRVNWISAVSSSASQTCANNSPTTEGTTTTESPTTVTTESTVPVESFPNENLDFGYFTLRALQSKPDAVGSHISSSLVNGVFRCGLFCLLSDRCLSFTTKKQQTESKMNCSLYDTKADTFLTELDVMYYIRTDK